MPNHLAQHIGMRRRDGDGVVYLLHFDRAYKHARHYTGWSSDLPARLKEHADGHGARLLAVIAAEGIGWQLARTWRGRAPANGASRSKGARRCPLCGVTPRERVNSGERAA
jgi:predicted GIY-YIG superfamily endonuclease